MCLFTRKEKGKKGVVLQELLVSLKTGPCSFIIGETRAHVDQTPQGVSPIVNKAKLALFIYL